MVPKLNYVGRCCQASRLYISRMLDVLRRAHNVPYVELDEGFRRDVAWFLECLRKFNGVHLMERPITHTLEADSSLTAGGAVMGQFPELCYSSLLQPFVDKTGMAVPWLQCTSPALM